VPSIVVHCWADLQSDESVHGFHCYDNISPNVKSLRVLVLAPYFHTWCGLSANLECRSETCCARLAGTTGRKKSRKSRHLGTIPQIRRVISSQLRHVSTIRKILVKHLLNMYPQYGELWPTSGLDHFVSLGHPSNFNWFGVLAALLHGTLVVGVSQTLRR